MSINANEKLLQAGIRPSVQRTLIYAYLYAHRTHPTVEEIYEALHPQIPTLSKTTIYNTLTLFVEHGLITAVNVEEKNQRYDAETALHAHFRCDCCGKIVDFPFPALTNGDIPAEYDIQRTEVTYRGLCADCRKMKNTTNL